ncbi:hypothetical protein DSO57_1024600 [Entomophthora muscae]|uniref:Uncharacterized protein n=1 Tax=Entomophthora muscae TaxID=34485 RepID=A0ACC2TPJ0_9FUNG|nr:hypothetical protein DSO57_1024600 [Entomophthora muscae]
MLTIEGNQALVALATKQQQAATALPVALPVKEDSLVDRLCRAYSQVCAVPKDSVKSRVKLILGYINLGLHLLDALAAELAVAGMTQRKAELAVLGSLLEDQSPPGSLELQQGETKAQHTKCMSAL